MPPTDKALAVMTPFHVLALESVIRDARFDLDLLHDIESVVRYLVEHPERLAGEGQVVVDRKEMETTAASLARLADGVRQDTVVFSRLYDLFNRWLTQEKPE